MTPRTLFVAILLVFAWLAGGPSTTWGDILFLKNGETVEGHILRETESSFTIERGPTTYEIPASRIERVVKYANRDTSLVLLGDSFLKEKDYFWARRYYQRALQQTQYPEVILDRLRRLEQLAFVDSDLSEADEALEKGDYRLAADLYQSLLAGHPDDIFTQEIRKRASEAYCSLGGRYFEENRMDEAIDELRRAMDLNAMNPKAHALAGKLLAGRGQYELARMEYGLALELDPRDSLAREGLAALGGSPPEGNSVRLDARPLNELFGETAFRGRLAGFSFGDRGKGLFAPSAVKFNLGALADATKGEYPPYSFSTDRALSIFLQAYNAGPNATVLYNGSVPYTETRNYTQRVARAVDDIAAGRLGKTAYDEKIEQYAKMFGFSPTLIKAIVKVESDFNPKTVSTADARGLIQLVRVDWNDTMKRIGKDLEFDKNVFNVDLNLYVGCHYLRWLVDDFLPTHFKVEFKR